MKKPEFKIEKDHRNVKHHTATLFCINCDKKVGEEYYQHLKKGGIGDYYDWDYEFFSICINPEHAVKVKIDFFGFGGDVEVELHPTSAEMNWPSNLIQTILKEAHAEHEEITTEKVKEKPTFMFCSESCLTEYLKKKLNEKIAMISQSTALASITALRNWNKVLEQQKKDYEKQPGFSSHVASVEQFQELSKKAFDELQKGTGDETPWEVK